MALFRSKDGSVLIKDPEGIMKWRHQYSTDLLFNHSVVDETAIESISQCDIIRDLDVSPSKEEADLAIGQINIGKVPEIDCIPVELLQY